jgi:hypothetical protein
MRLSSRPFRVPHGLTACAAGSLTLLVYLRTLAPGLVAEMDTPKFQFVGRVLGIPHNPGYPLYVLVGHLFSWLPVGTIAFRANLMSAVFGSITAGLAAFVLARSGVPAAVSLAAAVAAALGRTVWGNATMAEVYSLETALLMGTVAALVAWAQSRRPAAFFTAVACFALSLGHHTTIVLFLPPAAVFALAVDRAWVLRGKRLAATAAMLLLGLAQYGFILLRTAQGAVFNESPAHSLPQLAAVVAGRQFQHSLFAFGPSQLLHERLPLVAGLFARELTWPGALLAVAGLVVLAWRRQASWWLLAGGIGAYSLFTLNYQVPDPEVFLIPAFVLAWLSAGFALGGLASGTSARRAGIALASLALPAWLFAQNLAVNDRSEDTATARYFTALFPALHLEVGGVTPRFVVEDFLVDRLVQYKLLGEGAGRGEFVLPRAADVEAVSQAGARVFAFGRGASRLRLEGLGFEPITVWQPSLDDCLRRLPRGTITLLALPRVPSSFSGSGGRLLERLGDARNLRDRLLLNVAVIGVAGGREPEERFEASHAEMSLASGHAIGRTGVAAPADLSVRVDADETVISVDGREVVRAPTAGALVLLEPSGAVKARHVLPPSRGWAPEFTADALTAYRLAAVPECASVAVDGGWRDDSGLAANGRLLLRMNKGGSAVLYAAASQPLQPKVLAGTERAEWHLDVEEVAGAARDPLTDRPPLPAAGHVYRLTVRNEAAAHPDVGVVVAFGGVPERVWTRNGTGFDVSCRDRGLREPVLAVRDRAFDDLGLSNGDRDLLGRGWLNAEGDAAGAFRWFEGEASLLVPAGDVAPEWIEVDLLTSAGADAVSLAVNGAPLEAQSATPGWHTYRWLVRRAAWRPGTNELVIRAGGDGKVRTAARRVRFRAGQG